MQTEGNEKQNIRKISDQTLGKSRLLVPKSQMEQAKTLLKDVDKDE